MGGEATNARRACRLRREMSDDSKPTTRRPTRFGMYTVEEEVGSGGMGTVYRARHALLRRPAAIKVLSRGVATEIGQKRFEREVQLSAKLGHPNTISIFDYGRTRDGTLYYVMEHVEGLDLRRLVTSDGAQPEPRAIHILTQLLGALAEAHAAGIVHRDVKPSNILLGEVGGMVDVVKVVDFGLVKPAPGGSYSQITVDGLLLGTPRYMAPEMIMGSSLADARSDVYAVGLVAYFLLAGVHAVPATDLSEVITLQQRQMPPAIADARGEAVAPDLDAFVTRCIQKDPERRFADAGAALRALEACRDAGAWSETWAREWWASYRATVDAVRAAHSAAADDDPTALTR